MTSWPYWQVPVVALIAVACAGLSHQGGMWSRGFWYATICSLGVLAVMTGSLLAELWQAAPLRTLLVLGGAGLVVLGVSLVRAQRCTP